MSAGKIIGGALLGVGAIAAAPFTGGGSLFAAGVSLSAALGSGATVAAISAGFAGGTAGAVIAKKEKKDRQKENKNHFIEGVKSGAIKTKEKFSTILKTQKERDQLMLLAIKMGVYVSKIDGKIDDKELEELNKLSLFIEQNPSTPKVVKKEVKQIIKSDITFDVLSLDIDFFLEDKPENYRLQTIDFFNKLIETIINADGTVHLLEKDCLKNWNNKYKN